MLTNFTEFNRCRPGPGGAYVTYANTGNVHAADDLSVLQTLEALPQIMASARALAGDRPQRLGLLAIGARLNPYGASVAANPQRQKLAMAAEDPRIDQPLRGCLCGGAAAAAAAEGVEALALGPWAARSALARWAR